MAIPTPIRKWIEQFTSERGFLQSSSDVDHDATSNRTHDGDDLSPATLEATGSIIDPEGNTVTDLSQDFRFTEEASTFSESDITVTLNSTQINNGSVELLTPLVVDDFEDSDITVKAASWDGWNLDTGSLTAQSNTVISGSVSGELSVNNSSALVRAQRDTSDTVDAIKISTIIGSDVGNSNDESTVGILGSGAGAITEVEFIDGTQNILVNGTNVGNWTAGTTYNIEFTNIDYQNENVDIIINGTNEGTFNFIVSESELQYVFVDTSTTSSASARSVFFDDVEEGGTTATSGDALVAFDSGVPADIDSWDLATSQRTLDGETVTIDVEDSNGTVLKSDISKDTDISDIANSTDVQLRANLSRNNTANNPTVDYLARRFTR